MEKQKLVITLTLVSVPFLAFANAGLPMLYLVMPALSCSIIPIIIIESLYLRKKLLLTPLQSFKLTTITNLFSTLIGIPLTWVILVCIQLLFGGGRAFGLETISDKILSVTFQAPWLIPYDSAFHWMVPVAALVLMVPFFFASWLSEFWIATKRLKKHSKPELKVAIRNANLITYALLTAWPIGFWILNN